jgi:hypothetical protein
MWIGKEKHEGVKPVNGIPSPQIRKEKDGIPLSGLTPSCFSLPIHISGRRRMEYH